MFVLLTLWASGCTNDYGDFRYPKGTTTSPDAGIAPAADAGHDTSPTD
jgi:hypothetical protein